MLLRTASPLLLFACSLHSQLADARDELSLVVKRTAGGFIQGLEVVVTDDPSTRVWSYRQRHTDTHIVAATSVAENSSAEGARYVVLTLEKEGLRWSVSAFALGRAARERPSWKPAIDLSTRWSVQRDPCKYDHLTARFVEWGQLAVEAEGRDCAVRILFDLQSAIVRESPGAAGDRSAGLALLEAAERIALGEVKDQGPIKEALRLTEDAQAYLHALSSIEQGRIWFCRFRLNWMLSEFPDFSPERALGMKRQACADLRMAVLAGHEDQDQWLQTVCAAIGAKSSQPHSNLTGSKLERLL